MQVEKTRLDGVFLLTPKRFGDARGFFSESWSKRAMAEHGLDFDWVQDNHSLSMQAGTVRGLHFQSPPHAQDKLVRCGRGALFDVAVDIRRGSPTYGQWVGYELSFENGRQLAGARGFPARFRHTGAGDRNHLQMLRLLRARMRRGGAVRLPQIGIDWNLGELEPVLSEKDAAAPRLRGFRQPVCL